MGIGGSTAFVMLATNVSVPGGFNYCSQNEMADLYTNFVEQLNEDVVGLEYCWSQIVESAVNYKVSLVVEDDTDTYIYDHFNLEETSGDQYTVECHYWTDLANQPTYDC